MEIGTQITKLITFISKTTDSSVQLVSKEVSKEVSFGEEIENKNRAIKCQQTQTVLDYKKKNMSKFFAAGDSSSSDDSGDSDSEPEILPQKVAATKGRPAIIDSDSDSDEEKRVVKSHKDKAWESMGEGVIKIRNSMKINEWSMIYDEFGKVNALVEKGKAKNGIPKFYIKMLGDLSDFVVASIKDKEAVKKMKKPTAHALNQMKLAIRKQCDKYRAEVDEYKANPEAFVDEPVAGGGKSGKHDPSDSDDSSSDDDDSGSSEDDSAESSDVSEHFIT